MPLLQIIFQTIHDISPQFFGAMPKPLNSWGIFIISVIEVFFRLFLRVQLLPHTFYLISVITILHYLYMGAYYFLMVLIHPLSFTQQPFGFHEVNTKLTKESFGMFSRLKSPGDLIIKAWLISDYCYDRFLLHAPLCLYNLLNGNPVHKYSYRPRGAFSRSYKKEYQNNSSKLAENSYKANLRSFNLNASPTTPQRSPFIQNLFVSESRLEDITVKVTPDDKNLSPSLKKNYLEDYSLGYGQSFNPTPPNKSPIASIRPTEEAKLPLGTRDSIKIKFSRKSSSGNSFMSLHRSKRKPLQVESEVFNYQLVKEEIIKSMEAPEDFDDGSFGPLFVRLAWHSSATYDQETGTGGSNGGTMRFTPELTDPGNTGLHVALLEMETIKLKFPWISYGDLWTLGGATALEAMGCHPIPWKPGRVDCVENSKVPPNGRLPVGYLGSEHIKRVFMSQLGFDERETTLLIGGGHSLGRCHAKYSGWEGKWTENPVHFSNRFFVLLLEGNWELDKVPATGKEQYFEKEKGVMLLNTDMELIKNPDFSKWVEYYAKDNELFLKDFAVVFGKLIELGVPR